jgi:hypothetical protein
LQHEQQLTLYRSNPQKKKMERKLVIQWAKNTVDEIFEQQLAAAREKQRVLETGQPGSVNAGEAQAQVSIELKLMQEEQAQKVEESQIEHKEKMAAVEKEARSALIKAAGGDSKDSKLVSGRETEIEALHVMC